MKEKIIKVLKQKLFIIPVAIFIIITLFPLDEENIETLTWQENLIGSVFIILIWFILCYLVIFLKERWKKEEKQTKPKETFLKKYKHPKRIKNAMIILFILTLLSMHAATFSLTLVANITNTHGFNLTKITWIFWLWEPTPILSIILGFKLKKEGLKCTKNIVAGFIMCFYLTMFGFFSLLPTFEADYSNLKNYENILNVKIPEKGKLEMQNWDTYFEEDKKDYQIIITYFNKQDGNKFLKEIEKKENWKVSSEISSNLKILIPFMLKTNPNTYISIYNKTQKEYNKIPTESGNYIIYTMWYNKIENKLEIHKFNYTYKR